MDCDSSWYYGVVHCVISLFKQYTTVFHVYFLSEVLCLVINRTMETDEMFSFYIAGP
jgi:hypothetical protein